eukprot:jgi/Mesvir1/2931/Mv13997-RA.1
MRWSSQPVNRLIWGGTAMVTLALTSLVLFGLLLGAAAVEFPDDVKARLDELRSAIPARREEIQSQLSSLRDSLAAARDQQERLELLARHRAGVDARVAAMRESRRGVREEDGDGVGAGHEAWQARVRELHASLGGDGPHAHEAGMRMGVTGGDMDGLIPDASKLAGMGDRGESWDAAMEQRLQGMREREAALRDKFAGVRRVHGDIGRMADELAAAAADEEVKHWDAAEFEAEMREKLARFRDEFNQFP